MIGKTTPRVRGMTLLEVLLVVGLVTILGFVAIEFTRTMLEFQARTQASQELEANGRIALEFLKRTIRSSTAIRIPASGASGAIIELDVLDAAHSPTRIQVQNDTLLVTEGALSPWALTNSRVKVRTFASTALLPASTPAVLLTLSLGHTNPENLHALSVSENFAQTVRLAH